MGFIPGMYDGNEAFEMIKQVYTDLKITVSEENISTILRKFISFDPYDNVILKHEVFPYLEEFIKTSKKIEFTRSEFLDYLVSKNINKKDLSSLVYLALVLELMQTNNIPSRDFYKLLTEQHVEDIDAKIEIWIKNNFLIFNKKTNEISFIHHNVQEYLASKFIVNKKDPIEILSNLIVLHTRDAEALKTSWYGVVSFLFESEYAQKVGEWLVDFVENHPNEINDAFSVTILSNAKFAFSQDLKKKIFDLIYMKYQEVRLWLPVWTRDLLAEIWDGDITKLKQDLAETGSEIETYVHRGNVVMLIEHLLEIKNKNILTQTEIKFWKSKLIDFANDSYHLGVLQRFSLHALAQYHDASIIEKVSKTFSSDDSGVREAFIIFCYNTDPNNPLTIHYLVEGFKKKHDIYARHGIYEINSKDGIKLLLDYFISDKHFLSNFVEHETVFNNDKEKQDDKILNRIKHYLDEEILKKLKSIVKVAFESDNHYDFDDSYFLLQIVKLIKSKDKNYLFEILEQISEASKADRLLYNYNEVFIKIIEPSDLKKFFSKVSEMSQHDTRDAERVVYQSKWKEKEKGGELYEAAVKQKLVKRLKPSPGNQETNEDRIYKEFRRLLEPEVGKYSPEVFKYFNRNYELLKQRKFKNEQERLIKLIKDSGLSKIDPKEIKVSLDKANRGTYKISQTAVYYGDILESSSKLLSKADISEYRQNIIDFIPFSYSDDLKAIFDLIKKINNDDLRFVNSVYSDKNNDIRYFQPASFIYAIKEYNSRSCDVTSTIPILQSFIGDQYISDYDQRSALELYSKLVKSDASVKEYLINLTNDIESEDVVKKSIALIANSILISKFHDESAINWRFKELINRTSPYNTPAEFEVHSVSPLEEELDNQYFARPLIELKNPKYLPKFLELLNFTLTILDNADKKQLKPYIEYLWKITFKYLENLKDQGSFEPLEKLQSWIETNDAFKKLNWYQKLYESVYLSYVSEIGKKNTIEQCNEFIKKLK